ncbi:MAG TPA: helix-turn-helix domain-containing protein [Thermoleophilaceae bacterium]|nr:helix-turn-helix domain-containing protein [Thermoleophilaceae bacterium]
MPQAIGDTLREARMRQKIDITEIESKTKIRAKYLRAMENEEFDLLPGSTFAKSFLRTYADALGLDSHRLVEEYRSQYEPRDESDLPPLSSQPGARSRRGGRYDRRTRPQRRGLAIAAVAVVVIAVLVVVGILSDGGNNGNDGNTNAAQATTTTTKKTSTAKGAAPAKPAEPKRVVLKLTPAVATYVCVDRGQGTPVAFEGIIATERTWRGRHLRVNLGKTSVVVTENGKHVPLAVGPNPAGLDFTPGHHKNIPAGSRPCA